MTGEAPGSSSSNQLDQRLAELASVLEPERPDLAARIGAARVRVARPATVVCVVGEFKQGKSSLVNSLIGVDICPVDDDIATAALTLVRHGEQPSAVVRYAGDTEPRAEPIDVDNVARFVTEHNVKVGGDEAGDAHTSDRLVERVDVSVPSPLLADGLVLVDSPGMGGLGAGHAAATLSFLPFADGLIFVSDATSELTATELDFLTTALERCPNVVLAATKTDLASSWRRVMELNRTHLDVRELALPIVPVSSALRAAAFAARDRALNERSGVPELLATLDTSIIGPARTGAVGRAVDEATSIIDATVAMLDAERSALDDPSAADRLSRQAQGASARLDELRAGSARWQTVLGDRITDLSTEVTHRLRGSIRATTRSIEDEIESITTAEQWDDLARTLQTDVAAAVAQAFTSVERGRVDLRAELASLLAADDVVGPTSSSALDVLDTAAMWRSRGLDPKESTGGRAFKTGMTGLRGAQGGVLMFGISSQFLPQAAAVFIASNPVLLGAGALFGGFQLLEDRKRKLQMRRQAARTQLRTFTDDVQFEVTNELTTLLRSVQRGLRDEFVDLIGELQASWTAAATQASDAVAKGDAETTRRRQELGAALERLAALRNAISGAPVADQPTRPHERSR
ncbi:MAG: dynamin family protein [Actinomycetota bacterium]